LVLHQLQPRNLIIPLNESVDELKPRALDLYRYFLAAYPGRTALMMGLMSVAGVAEGIGVLALIPVLEFAESATGPSSAVGLAVVRMLGSIGLEPTLAILLLGIVVLITVKALFLLLANRQVGFVVAQVTRDLRLQLVRAVLKVRWRYFSGRTIGQFTSAIVAEANRAAAAYREACHLVAALIQILAYLVIAATISWRVALGTIVIAGVMGRLLRGFVRAGRSSGHDQTRLNRSLSSRLIDVLQGIKPLKAMGREQLVWPLLAAEVDGLNQAQRKQVAASEGLRAFQEPLLTVLLACGLFFVIEVGNQPLSSVLILAFVFYRLMQHINTLQMRYQIMSTGESAFFSILDEIAGARAEEEHAGGGRQPGALRKGIELRGVSFGYGDRSVLDHVSLSIPAGGFVALTGESGSGKTTLADLVAGLYLPEGGVILVDEVPLQELDLYRWRQQIGYVPQEMLLFNDTILRNVTLGEEGIGRDEVEEALTMAGAWDFVTEKPRGLDHLIGERGGTLSGGQRQRIAIARALVRKPSLLILDEVTTALDPATEQAICDTLRDLSGKVTILSISHQPALRDAADVAYLMHGGRLEPLKRTADV
jgi:ATP-binding cassette subfamily C protein